MIPKIAKKREIAFSNGLLLNNSVKYWIVLFIQLRLNVVQMTTNIHFFIISTNYLCRIVQYISFSLFKIEWIGEELPVEPMQQGYRKNVCQYDPFSNKIEYQNDSNNKPVTIGKNKYCQCTREWRFWNKEKNIATRIQ